MKNEFKGTKGEWGIRNAMPDSSENIEIKTNNVLSVGINCESDEDFMVVALCGRDISSEAQANAKLIAAAPEILESLIELVNSNPIHEGYHEKKLKAINVINKAI